MALATYISRKLDLDKHPGVRIFAKPVVLLEKKSTQKLMLSNDLGYIFNCHAHTLCKRCLDWYFIVYSVHHIVKLQNCIHVELTSGHTILSSINSLGLGRNWVGQGQVELYLKSKLLDQVIFSVNAGRGRRQTTKANMIYSNLQSMKRHYNRDLKQVMQLI